MIRKRRISYFIFLLLASFLFFPLQARAILELNIHGSSLDFGFMGVDEEKRLADEGTFHQEISCKSTNNRTWHLEVYCLEPLSSAQYVIPEEYFRYSTVWTNGKGNLINEHQFVPLTTAPSLTYISQAEDNTGNEVKIRFKYRLHIPLNQPMGNYYTTIRFSLIEPL